MRVLVTGNRGYVGTVLSPMLLERGHRVLGLDSELFEQCTFGPEPVDVPTIREDIRDVRVEALHGIEAARYRRVSHLRELVERGLVDDSLRRTLRSGNSPARANGYARTA